jgi:hypothetical protein
MQMGDYTHVFYAHNASEELSSRPLALPAIQLGLPMPRCKGRVLPNGRWEIETRIEGRGIVPYTEDIVYTKEYPNWNKGADMAMFGALSRLCYTYCNEMPPESPFRHFPRCDAEEILVMFMDNRADLPMHTLHMQDMGTHIMDVENMLQEEIAVNAQSNVVINQQNEELLTAHDAVDVLEGTVIDLEAQLAQKDALIAAKDA